MLRSFAEVSRPANKELLVAAQEGHATLTGNGTYAMPWHWHDCLMFIIPSHGAVELRLEDQRASIWLSQDRFAVVPSGRSHRTRAGCAAHTHTAIYVTGEELSRLDKIAGSLGEFRRRTQTTVCLRRTAAIRALQELSSRNDISAYGGPTIRKALSSALLMQCIGEVLGGQTMSMNSPQEHGMALVADIEAFLVSHSDQNIPLDALEERFGVSRRHITRLFREGTGLSIGQFQQQARYKNAHRLLTETDLPINDVAYRVGFESGAALTRAMRRLSGQSPSDLRVKLARSVKN